MMKKYNKEIAHNGKEFFWYEENGIRYVFIADESNPFYQRYLNPEAEDFTPSVTDEA
jgi:hypothetical protein